MYTSKYDKQTRKHLRRFQRTSEYQAMRKQQLAERERLETALRARNETIERLKKKLVSVGVAADEVAQLAAA